MGKTRGEPGAVRAARRVREGAHRRRPAETPAPRPWAYLTPWSQAVLLVAGNKAGDWNRWYKTAIPIAESAYQQWLANERKRREA